MNNREGKYSKFALVREMLETSEVVRKFDVSSTRRFADRLSNSKALFLSGEGSSRIFPAKRAIYSALKNGGPINIVTEGSTQAMEYKLDDYAVFGASNSGQTKEVVRLFMKIKEEGHQAYFGLTANANTRLEKLAIDTHVMNCGKEDAVAATKSVIEQGLFYDSIVHQLAGKELEGLDDLADAIEAALTLEIDPEIVEVLRNADLIYFAGRNTGVVEELTLKTNEITRKKSDFLEGTYAVHGIEEVMDKNEVVIVVDPFESEEEKFKECLVDGVGMQVVAISSRQTSFPTIQIPHGGDYKDYVELAAGWNVLVEIGIALGIDLDKPVRARKVGNEYFVQE
ncbi:MAG: sugar isomerase [Bacteroidetes bacterium]|jgi:glutamine---fructose-6-phosphate transaminase (isomerizing)|nr:sugar isomerase [Bacteroidota bacterium]MBT4398858.1 sugar isomerase [Bacteroidota bacterium]MBT4411615.1 sugar isomerase [Bacteroidota bacterium]MBT7093964.1 sugar isomerase [Bacteroidota bacterium]MBT7465273.1 sugar isomerase [Bacteroidota bacterium]